jgi:aryl-alcohol dehydrogenase-like predicted oxidoreductase
LDHRHGYELAILDAAFEAGLNVIDTADFYSRFIPGNAGGESEAVIGAWMKDRGVRDRVVIITKVGLPMGEVCRAWAAIT